MYEVRTICKKEKNDDGEWMYLTEWKVYDDITWETADTLRVGANDVLNDFNKKRSRKYNPGPKSKMKRSDE